MNSPSPAPRKNWKPGRFVTVGLAGLLLNCTPASSLNKESRRSTACLATATHEPVFTPLARPKAPKSQIWVHAEASLSDLESRIAQLIPRQLAYEKNRSIGAAGEATYRVTRGQPRVKIRGDQVEVHVPIRTKISVCKPTGLGCLRYGRCSPTLRAKFSLDTRVSPSYQLTPPRGTIRAESRCVIGIDVTQKIEQIARREVRQVETTIRKRWPDFKPMLDQAWQQLSTPLPLAADQCVTWAPSAVQYTSLRSRDTPLESDTPKTKRKGDEQTSLTMAVGLSGRLKPASSCTTPSPVAPLPPPEKVASAPSHSQIWVPEQLTIQQAMNDLRKSLDGDWEQNQASTLKIAKLKLRGDRFALLVQVTGSVCGKIWLEGTIDHNLRNRELTLSSLKPSVSLSVAESSGKAPVVSREEQTLLSYLEKNGRIRTSANSRLEAAKAAALQALHTAELPDDLHLYVGPLTAKKTRVFGDEQGLHLSHLVSIDLQLRAQTP